MAVRKGFLLRALLKWNYLPMQKKRKEELPPVFVSSDLTKDIAEQLSNITLGKQRKNDGFDCVKYFATRYNNVPRLLSIPHPKPYCELCLELYRNWSRIERICANTNSLVRPQEHRDKRTIIMDYENAVEKRKRCNKQAFGKKYIVHTDIANFYPGFYSHVIPWALVGIRRAKRERNNSSKWFNKIDKSLRMCCRCETAGVPIGPATSNIVCEIVLERIDRVLKRRFSYIRFIDDYTAYCETETQADEFIRELSKRLLKYKLNLNINKTGIDRLPQTIDEEWVNRVREIVPQGTSVTSSQVSNILETALILQEDNPDGSVLKYAINSIVERLNDESSLELVKYAIKLCLHYPVLIPTLRSPLETIYGNNSENFETELLFLLDDSIKYRRSDATCWLLYYLRVFHGDIPTDISERIVEWGDCMALALLAEYPTRQREVTRFARKLDKTDLHELDNYWLLLYQLYLKGKIRNPYSNDDTFKILKKHGVSFVRF
jgi:hypothetical protein